MPVYGTEKVSQNTMAKLPNGLTVKQWGFVQDYAATGNGTQAALANYDTDDVDTAKSIACENLTKPYVAKTLAEMFSDEKLREKHDELLGMKKFDYFVFSKDIEDEEIIEHVNAIGIEVVNIRPTEKGKMVFYHAADAVTQKAALDMAYKLKGSYAPEKSINVNIEAEDDGTIKSLTAQLNALHRGTSQSGHGGSSSTMGGEAQDQE